MRNLWSANIFTLEKEICHLIGLLCGSSVASLKRVLQRVCVQLSDLSAPIAVFVVKASLDALKKNFGQNFEAAEKNVELLQALMEQVRTSMVTLADLNNNFSVKNRTEREIKDR